MPRIYFAGFSASKLIGRREFDDNGVTVAFDQFNLISCDGITGVEIGWDYLLIWKNHDLYISGKITSNNDNEVNDLLPVKQINLRFKQAIAGSENVVVLTDKHELWLYNIYSFTWKSVPNFILNENGDKKEYVIKISQGRCTVVLTNLGRVFCVPISLNNPDLVKFVDIACGYDHTLMLADTGDVYSMGMGTRGQLGHGDLEDCDEPKLIEALAGLNVKQISASGWHSAVITNQGDLYTWGWNNQGQLGHLGDKNVVPTPTPVDFIRESQGVTDVNIVKVDCGSTFTMCKSDTGSLWGSGCNKYGQLGQSRTKFPVLKQFILIPLNNIEIPIEDFKCREWGTCIYTS